MTKLSANTKSILSKVNEILSISDSYQAPDRVLQLVLSTDRKERNNVYNQLADLFDNDYSKDWFFEYFQEEHADRHQNKQDFTPPSLASIIHHVLRDGYRTEERPDGRRITYEPAAGTGQLIIRDWWLNRKRFMPWEYRPIDHLIVCSELSVKTVPFLLLNLAVRGMCGMVFHMNTMTKEVYAVYVVCNPDNNPCGFSDVQLMEQFTPEQTEAEVKQHFPEQLSLFDL